MPDFSDEVFIDTRSIVPFSIAGRGDISCPSPGGDWCNNRTDWRMIGGVKIQDDIIFYWQGAPFDNTFRFTYIEAAKFSITNNLQYTGRPLLWSNSGAYTYAFMASDTVNNKLAASVFFGNSTSYPSIAIGFNGDPNFPSAPWNMKSYNRRCF